MTEDKFVDVDGTKIRYRENGGNGPAVLFTHGIGGSLELWDKQLAALDPTLRLIAWDMPGHGLSDIGKQPYGPESFATFAWRFLDRIGVKKAHLVGNSLGAAVSLRMAGLAPDRAESLLLANAATLGRENPLPFRLMTLPVLGSLMNKPSPMAVKQQIDAIFQDPAVADEALRAIISRNVHRPGGSAAFIATLRLMGGMRGQHQRLVDQSLSLLTGLKVPALFVHGRHDKVIPVDHSIAAAKITPGSNIEILEDSRHTPQVEKPEVFNQLVSKLLSPGG